MEKEIEYAVNDLLDCVEELTRLVYELNPGAGKQIDHIRFFLNRADRSLRDMRDRREREAVQ